MYNFYKVWGGTIDEWIRRRREDQKRVLASQGWLSLVLPRWRERNRQQSHCEGNFGFGGKTWSPTADVWQCIRGLWPNAGDKHRL